MKTSYIFENHKQRFIPATLPRVAGDAFKYLLVIMIIIQLKVASLYADDTVSHAQMTVSYECILSKNLSHTRIDQGPVTEFNGSPAPGLGVGCKFTYNIFNNISLKSGLEAGCKTYTFKFDIPANKYIFEREYMGKIRYFGGYAVIPLKIGYTGSINNKYDWTVSSGIVATSFLRGTFGKYGYSIGEKGRILELKGEYQPDYQVGFAVDGSIIKKINKKHGLEFSLMYRQCFSEIFAVDYTFFPEIDKYLTTGEWYTRGGFIGLKIGYLIY